MATALHRGRLTASYEIVATDERERRVCTARLTCALVQGGRPAQSGGGPVQGGQRDGRVHGIIAQFPKQFR